jgi:hypothetical protein
MTELAMRTMLRASSLHTLIVLTSKMLARSGFGDVEILDRRHVKQKSRFGGHELLCESTVGALPLKVIVKVINDDVRLRMLDEMAGAVMRMGADLGIIVSPRSLTAAAKKYRNGHSSSRVVVIDGTEFVARLLQLGIAVRCNGEPDYAFFAGLEERLPIVNKFLVYERLAR